jgi:electron transfer flavoprotein alpha/beta subunit
VCEILTHIALLMPTFALPFTPAVLTVDLHCRTERSPTIRRRRTAGQSVASVPSLSPVEFSARIHLTSELLRTLSMVAASEPTSWLSMRIHILYHLAWI